MFGQTLAAVVKRMGHDAVIAFNMKEGLDTARSDVFDVVLLDVGLPEGSGLCLLPQIKELPSCPEVIIITGCGDQSNDERSMYATNQRALDAESVFPDRDRIRCPIADDHDLPFHGRHPHFR